MYIEDIKCKGEGQTLRDGAEGDDACIVHARRTCYPISVECKNTERASVWEWIKQAEGHNPDYPAVVFFKRNRSKMYALVEADQLLRWIKDAQA
jgi:hypothetical protein